MHRLITSLYCNIIVYLKGETRNGHLMFHVFYYCDTTLVIWPFLFYASTWWKPFFASTPLCTAAKMIPKTTNFGQYTHTCTHTHTCKHFELSWAELSLCTYLFLFWTLCSIMWVLKVMWSSLILLFKHFIHVLRMLVSVNCLLGQDHVLLRYI